MSSSNGKTDKIADAKSKNLNKEGDGDGDDGDDDSDWSDDDSDADELTGADAKFDAKARELIAIAKTVGIRNRRRLFGKLMATLKKLGGELKGVVKGHLYIYRVPFAKVKVLNHGGKENDSKGEWCIVKIGKSDANVKGRLREELEWLRANTTFGPCVPSDFKHVSDLNSFKAKKKKDLCAVFKADVAQETMFRKNLGLTFGHALHGSVSEFHRWMANGADVEKVLGPREFVAMLTSDFDRLKKYVESTSISENVESAIKAIRDQCIDTHKRRTFIESVTLYRTADDENPWLTPYEGRKKYKKAKLPAGYAAKRATKKTE